MVLKSSKKRRKTEGDEYEGGTLINIVREDQTYRKAKKQFDLLLQDVDTKSLIHELFTLQTSRNVNTLNRKVLQDALRKIVDASVDEILTRSRATTIKMQALQALIAIEEITSHLSKYLLAKYNKQMKMEGHTTITAQRAQVDVYMRRFLETKKQLEYVDKLANMVVEDIDQSSYSLRRITDAIDMGRKDR
ncbi:hypothetical protein [Rhizobium phage RHEph12]|nr:hypothetical protein [Rhizobium phage RHEph12]